LARAEAEVADLEHSVAVDEQVGALDVAVQDAVLVAVMQPCRQLLQVSLDLQVCTAIVSSEADIEC
jgi:hypothetical protein